MRRNGAYIMERLKQTHQFSMFLTAFLSAVFIFCFSGEAFLLHAAEPELDAKSAILMEAETRTVLYELNADEQLPPASVTKIMTLLLTMEAVDSGTISLSDTVGVSENAASMGGSQVFLAPGEQITVEDLIKSVVISSANDAAVALAEYISGSEESFVSRMNDRAAELGMNNTHFENTNGLDDTTVNHVTSARDIAIMSAELLSHEKITEYSSTWMDSIRGGEFTLTNTNKLVRFYNGATGLKTGSTSKAKFCISATAKRDGMHLIAVIMGSSTRDARNASAKKLLDIGFADYCYVNYPENTLAEIPVIGGKSDTCVPVSSGFSQVLPKHTGKNIEVITELPETLIAPVEKGTVIGRVVYKSGDSEIGSSDIVASETVERIDFFGIFVKIVTNFLMI